VWFYLCQRSRGIRLRAISPGLRLGGLQCVRIFDQLDNWTTLLSSCVLELAARVLEVMEAMLAHSHRH
jgi:hypothetical protein